MHKSRIIPAEIQTLEELLKTKNSGSEVLDIKSIIKRKFHETVVSLERNTNRDAGAKIIARWCGAEEDR